MTGSSTSDREQPRAVCPGCGKAVSSDGVHPGDQCHDCGAYFVEATPERLACDRCRHPDASRVFGSDHNRLCAACIAWDNRKEETPEEIAENYGQMVEFGRAVKLFESAAAELRRNGHETVGALEACDEAKKALETLFAEHHEMLKIRREKQREARYRDTASEQSGGGR